MAKCKTCGKQFHACTSCGLTYDWEWNYCSESCYNKSKEYRHMQVVATKLYSSLNDEQYKLLEELLGFPDDFQCTCECYRGHKVPDEIVTCFQCGKEVEESLATLVDGYKDIYTCNNCKFKNDNGVV